MSARFLFVCFFSFSDFDTPSLYTEMLVLVEVCIFALLDIFIIATDLLAQFFV